MPRLCSVTIRRYFVKSDGARSGGGSYGVNSSRPKYQRTVQTNFVGPNSAPHLSTELALICSSQI